MSRLAPQTASTGVNRRRTERKYLRVTADFRRQGRTPFTIGVRDLSETGCRCETVSRVHEGDLVWITIPGFQAIAGRIRWRDGREFGVEWMRPMHASVFEHIIAKYPSMRRGMP